MMTPEEIFQVAYDALCDGGEEQHDVHVTHDDKVHRILDAVTPLIELQLLERLTNLYLVDGSPASLDMARKLLYWQHNLDEIDGRLGEPTGEMYEQLWLEQVTPKIEADLLERVAAIYEHEHRLDGTLSGSKSFYRTLRGAEVVERLRYWRDNLTELAKLREGKP